MYEMSNKEEIMLDVMYECETIDELKTYIETQPNIELRIILLNEFDKLKIYKNIMEWNKLVRICEALAIVGWGEREALEALAHKWINGSYYTKINNRYFEYNVEQRWRKQKDTFVLDEEEADKTDYGISKFASQRNKLLKSPIRWVRSGNYQKSLQPFIDSLEELAEKIIRESRPELYGNDFSYIGLKLYFSHHDDKSPSVRYEYFHNEEDVPTDMKGATNPGGMPAYFIRPKFKIGRLVTKDNELRLLVTRHYTRKFGYLELSQQKQILKEDFFEIIDILSDKLKKKRIQYNTELLKSDMNNMFQTW